MARSKKVEYAAERDYQHPMSGKLAKASLHCLNDSRNETLEKKPSTVQCTACLKTSSLKLARRVVNDGGDVGFTGGILDLPVHIIFDIFSRLPLKQLFVCRSTCKTFRHLLSRPIYGSLSLDKAQPCLLLREFSRKSFPNFFNREAYVSDLSDEIPSTFFYSKAYLIDLEETAGCAGPVNISVNPSALIKHEIFSLPAGKLELVGSCNGLVCLHQRKTAQYYICNPLLGEWTVLPAASFESINSTTYSLFGFCPNIKRYKVVRLSSSSSQSSSTAAVEIITIGTSSWRYIGNGPRPKPRGSFSPCPVGDILLTTDLSAGSTSSIICLFNLETEQFHLVPSPPHFSPEYLLNLTWINVGWLHNSLCICYIHNESTLQIWTTDNRNITNPTWSVKSSVSFRYWNFLLRFDKHHPSVFVDDNYDLWMKHEGNRNLYKFSSQVDEMQAFKVSCAGTGFQIIAHIPSFVRLRDALMPNAPTFEVFRYGYKLWSP